MLLTPAKCGQSKSTVIYQNTPQVCFPVLCRNTRPRVGRLQCRWDVLAWRTGCWTMLTSTSCCPGCDRVRATPHCLLQLHLLSGAALHCRPAPRLRHGALASPAMKLPCVLRPYCRRLPLFTGLAVLHCTALHWRQACLWPCFPYGPPHGLPCAIRLPALTAHALRSAHLRAAPAWGSHSYLPLIEAPPACHCRAKHGGQPTHGVQQQQHTHKASESLQSLR